MGVTPATHINEEADKAAASPNNDKVMTKDKKQLDDGNYVKGHPQVQGFDIAIENPAGSVRKPQWPKMAHHYGDLTGTVGADGDPVDVFIKKDADIADDAPIFVVNQKDQKTGKFDEHKVMMGFDNAADAKAGYLANYTKDFNGFMDIVETTPAELKQWAESGKTSKPYVSAKPQQDEVIGYDDLPDFADAAVVDTEKESKLSGRARKWAENQVWKKMPADYRSGKGEPKGILYLNPETGATESWPVTKFTDAQLAKELGDSIDNIESSAGLKPKKKTDVSRETKKQFSSSQVGKLFAISKDTVMVPIDDVDARTENDNDAIKRGRTFMQKAVDGEMSPRVSLTAWKVKRDDGSYYYSLRDGNSTFAILKQDGLKEVPVIIEREINEADLSPIPEHGGTKKNIVNADIYEDDISAEFIEITKKELFENQAGFTLDDHYAVARDNQVYLNNVGKVMEDQIGVKFMHAPGSVEVDGKTIKVSESDAGEKSVKSAKGKLERKYNGDAGRMKDIVRGSFLVSEPSQIEAVVKYLGKRFKGLDEGWVMTPAGYADRKILIQFDNGQIGEIQVTLPKIYEAKELRGGHDLYEQYREQVVVIDGVEYAKPGSELYTEALKQDMAALYDKSWRESGAQWKQTHSNLKDQLIESTQSSNLSRGYKRPSTITSAKSTPSVDQTPSRKAAAATPDSDENKTTGTPSRATNLTGTPKDSGNNISNTSKESIAQGSPELLGKTTKKDQKSDYGKNNKVFTEDAAEKARAILKAKLGQLNAGIDPEMMQAGITLAGYHVESGARKFGQYAKAMVSDLGDGIKPYLKSFYVSIHSWPGFDTSGMTAPDQLTDELVGMALDAANTTEEKQDETGAKVPEVAKRRDKGTPEGRGLQPELPGDKQNDSDVEGEKPKNVRGAGKSGANAKAGAAGTGQDVAGDGRSDAGRDESTGSEGASREELDASGRRVGAAGTGNHQLKNNFHIEDPLEIVGGGQVARFDKNTASIELFHTLQEEDRQPTEEEKKILAGYTGWGSFGQELFQGSWNYSQPKKGWEKRDKWLRKHLGQSEWESAQRSITNSHYTDPPTVMAMWDMLARMGFEGGRVLEPAMGIGNFFSMMPKDMQNRSDLTGIELDELTGGMAKMLFPDANISIKPYQDSKTPDDFYDVVIGNWPFENTTIADRRYNKVNPYLHDYFYLKALDQVRPGGIVAAITTKGTLDKLSQSVRIEMAKKAELVTAIRLPTGAFQEYAGTQVVTDIIILKKRDQPLGIVDENWLESKPWKVRGETEMPNVNQFFHENKSNVIGTIGWGDSTTYNRQGLVVKRPSNMKDRLNEAVNFVDEGVYKPRGNEETVTYITNHTDDREGAMVEKDGDFYVVAGERLMLANDIKPYLVKENSAANKKKNKERKQQLKDIINIRKLYAELITAEQTQEADAEQSRAALNDAYQKYVKKNGPLNESYSVKYLARINDPFLYSIRALERNEGDKTNPVWVPSDILSESTMRGVVSIENPTIVDAFVLARNESVNPSLKNIAARVAASEEEVKAELIEKGMIFETGNGDIVPHDVYLGGNVRAKLRDAKSLVADGQKELQRNVDALEKVIPKDIPYHKIEVRMGAAWIDTQTYQDYVKHMLNLNDTDAKQVSVTYVMGKWKVNFPSSFNGKPEASAGFGSFNARFKQLVNYAISNQTLTIRGRDPITKATYVDEKKTKEVGEKIEKIRNDFGEWVWSDPQRRVRLEQEYNEARNSWASPNYDGSFLNMSGMALQLDGRDFALRKHIENAIWRAMVNKKSINAHEVGTGKTFVIAGIAVESRRYGIAKKPLILAHNANSASVAEGVNTMYPGAKVLYIDNLSPSTMKTRLAQIANDDWDAVVMPHSTIDNLTLKEETLMAMAKDEISMLEREAIEAAEEDDVTLKPEMFDNEEEMKKVRSPTAKSLVKQRNQIINKIKKDSHRSSKEGSVSFEDLGIDMILVDESHIFKKPPIVTKMRMKGLNTDVSNRSIALQYLSRYVRGQNGGNNIHLFTGTPITNTLTEIYHQMRYVMEDEMRAADVDFWDGWFGSFASEVTDVELNAAAEYENVTRLSSFINVPELRKMIGQYMDVVFADDMPDMQARKTASGKALNDPDITEEEKLFLENGRTENATDRPYKKVINVTSDMTQQQLVEFDKLQSYAKAWRRMQPKQRMETMRAGGVESPIITEGLATKASFDVRLLKGIELAGKEGQIKDDPGSKSSKVINNVKNIYDSHEKATQVIFTELGMGKSVKRSEGPKGKKKQVTYKNFSTVHDIVERLVQEGIPRKEIAVVNGSTTKSRRLEIADLMNKAELRVVIGSTETLGTGVNMQKNLRAMHHMDAPWMPGDLEQRNGRGHRQGNKWNTVLEYRYLTDRLDGRRWQILAIKSRFIKQFLTATDDTRVIEGEAASDEQDDILQTFSDASGDPRILIQEKLKKKIERLESKDRMHTFAVNDALMTKKSLGFEVERYHLRLKKFTPISEKITQTLEENAGDKFTAKLKGKKYNTRKGADKALEKLVSEDEISYKGTPVKIGEIMGLDASVAWPAMYDAPTLYVSVNDENISANKPSIQSLSASLRSKIAYPNELKGQIEDGEKSIERLEEIAKEPFAQAKLLADTIKDLEELKQDMQDNPVPPPSWLRQGAPIDTAIYHNGKELVVEGHRWLADGWYVVAGGKQIPYMDAKDAQGFSIYEEREFVEPEVVEQAINKEEGEAVDTGDEPVVYSKDSRVKNKPAKSINADRLRKIVDNIQRNHKGLRPIKIMVRETQDGAFGVGSVEKDGRIKGGFYGDSVVLVAENITNDADALTVIRHELVGHYGFRNLLNAEGEFDAMLDLIYSARNGELKDLYEWTKEPYENLHKSKDTRAIADEMLARAAETKPKLKTLDKIYAAIMRLLRKYNLVKGPISRKELNALILLSEKNLNKTTADGKALDKMKGVKKRVDESAGVEDLWTVNDQLYDSSATSINSGKLPAVFTKGQWLKAWKEGDINADIGGGRFDNMTNALKDIGVTSIIYDPFNRSPEWNKDAVSKISNGQSDTVTISNVLNVINESENRIKVIKQAYDALKPDGVAMISIYEGNGTGEGKATSKGWQENKKKAMYLPEVQAVFPDAVVKGGMIIAHKPFSVDKVTALRRDDDVSVEAVGDNLGMPEESYKEMFVRLFQDSFNRVNKLQETITGKGGKVTDESDVYRAEERSSGKITNRLNKLKKQNMKPLIEHMERTGITLDQLDEYLIARHAPERNDYIAEINPDMQDGGSGMTNQEAAEFMDGLSADEKASLSLAAEKVYAVNRQTLNDLVEGGHLSADVVSEWQDRWEYYVPLKGKKGESILGGKGAGYSVSGSGIMSAMGRGADNAAESPTAHSFAQAESTIIRTEKTKIGQALVRLVRDNPDPEFWTISQRTFKTFEDLYGEPFEAYEEAPEGLIDGSDYHRVKAITKAELKLAEEEGRKPVAKVVYKLDPRYRQRQEVFSVMVDGKELLINIKDKVLAEQLKKMNITQLNAIVAGAGKVNRYLAAINTALNLEFVITNFERDFQTAMVNLSGEQSAAIAAEVAKSIPSAVKGIFQDVFDTKSSSQWRKEYAELQEAGGTVGFFGLEDIDTKVKKIKSELENTQTFLGKSRRGIFKVRDTILDLNLTVENAARLASYKIVKENLMANGMSKQEAVNKAASVAKNLTVNFNRKGELAPVMNSAYLFYGASIQGSARIFSAMKNRRVQKIVAGIVVLGFMNALINRNAGGDDDDDIPKWDKINDYTKQTNMVFMLPGMDEPAKIKMPYGYNVFFYTGGAIHDLMFDPRKTVMGTALNLLSAAANAFNPIQGADIVDTVFPTVLKPFEQDIRNINFMEAPIRPENPFDNYDRPASQKAFKSTNPQLKELMAYLNEATGGDETHPGAIDISPETVKHYVGWLTGGAGMFVARSLGTGINLATGEKVEQKNVPFLRTLSAPIGSRFDNERFYEAVKQVNAANALLKLYKGTDKYGEYKAKKHAVINLSKQMQRVKKSIKFLRDKRDKAYFDKDRETAREYSEQMRQLMMEFSVKYDDAVSAE